MGLGELFSWGGGGTTPVGELPDIFPIGILQVNFIKIDVVAIYSRILTDVVERTHGLSEDEMALLWDNCIKSESSEGLITKLAMAMFDKKDLFLIYDKALEVIREADNTEAEQIKADYLKSNKSSLGVYISFRHFLRSDMVKIYSALEYCAVSALNKSMNLSKAVQFKMSDLRTSVALSDSGDARAQAQAMAKSLSKGKDILLDAKDMIETALPNLDGVNAAMEFINERRAFYLGLPDSYICGEQTGGIGATGESDTKAIERGLKNYYYSIMKPVFDVLFETKTTYKSQDFTQITSASDILKTFSLTDDELVSKENKTLILNRLFDLPEDSEGDPPVKPDPLAIPAPGVPPVPGQVPPKPGVVPPKGKQ